MRPRNLLALSMCLAATACQPPTYRILAHQDRYQLIFTAQGSGAWPFHSNEGIEASALTVRDRTSYVWAVELDPDQAGCRNPSGTPPFPVAYGSSVACFRTLVAPQSIRRDTVYRVEGLGIRQGSGFFRYEPFAGGGRATNLDWDEVEAEVRGWPPLPNPIDVDQARNSTSAAPATAETNAVSANSP